MMAVQDFVRICVCLSCNIKYLTRQLFFSFGQRSECDVARHLLKFQPAACCASGLCSKIQKGSLLSPHQCFQPSQFSSSCWRHQIPSAARDGSLVESLHLGMEALIDIQAAWRCALSAPALFVFFLFVLFLLCCASCDRADADPSSSAWLPIHGLLRFARTAGLSAPDEFKRSVLPRPCFLVERK